MRWLIVLLAFWSCLVVAGTPVEVEGSGPTLDQAKKNAFHTAIQQVVGTLIVNDKMVKGNKLVKDDIAEYSAGFIEDYEILESFQDVDQTWNVRMYVKVAESKIAQRMLSRAENNENIHGPKVYDSVQSEIEMRNKGTQLLSQVLDSYPNNAYIINSGQSEFKVGRMRDPYIDFDYNITMSRSWVEAFNEAVSLVAVDSGKCNSITMKSVIGLKYSPTTSQGTKDLAQHLCGKDPDLRIFYKAKGDFLAKAYSYYLPDQITLDAINTQFRAGPNLQYIALRVDLLDAEGGTIDSRCTQLNNRMFVAYDDPAGDYNVRDRQRFSHPNVMGQNSLDGSIRLHLKTVEQIENLARIRMSIDKSCN